MKSSKLKVLYISGSWPPIMCGVGDYLYSLTKHLKSSWAVVTSKEASGEDNVLNIVRGWYRSDWQYIKQEIDKLEPEIIHYQYPSVMYGRKLFPNIMPKYIKRSFPSKKMVITVHEYHDATYLGKKRIELTLRQFKEVIVTNLQDKNELKNKFPNKNIEIIRVGSSIEYINVAPKQKDIISQEINPKNKKLIVYFGYIDPSKGIENLIGSMSEWAEGARLVLATEHNPNNTYHKKINDLIVSKGLDIHWTGYLSSEKASRVLQLSDLVILPFDSPISARRSSMIAAISHGCCVITTGPSEEIFVHEQNCYLMKGNSGASISEAIGYLLKNQKLVKKIKAEAKKTRHIFNWDMIAKKHDRKYKTIHTKI